MSFYDTPVRRLRVVRGCGAFVLALGIGCVPLFIDLDEFGRVACCAAVAFGAGAGLVYLWLAKRTPASETIREFPRLGPPAQQIRYFRRALWIIAVVFPAGSAMIAYDLHRLESSAAEHVTTWEPAALIYSRFGYWPAVSTFPVFGVVCCALCFYMLARLRMVAAPSELRDKMSEAGSHRPRP